MKKLLTTLLVIAGFIVTGFLAGLVTQNIILSLIIGMCGALGAYVFRDQIIGTVQNDDLEVQSSRSNVHPIIEENNNKLSKQISDVKGHEQVENDVKHKNGG